jgi:hypothetical protein
MNEDLICSECSYPLRGLSAAGKCPECGNFYSARTGDGVKRVSTDPKLEKIDSVARSGPLHYVLFGFAVATAIAGVLRAPFLSDAIYFGVSITLIVVLVVMLVYEKIRTGPSWWE